MPIAESGMTVNWADGKKTTFTLRGDLQNSTFPNTDPEFFLWFGENWAVPPDPATGQRGNRQSLVVDSHNIQTVGVLLEKMRAGDNEWGVPPGVISDLQMHAAAAVRFPQGWAASEMRRKYLPGSVASDPKPKPPAPPAVDPQVAALQAKLAEAAQKQNALEAELAEARRLLAEAQKPASAPAGDIAKRIKVELDKATVELGVKAAGKWWMAYQKRVEAIAALLKGA